MSSRTAWVTDQDLILEKKIKTKQKKTHIASRNELGGPGTNMKERQGGRERIRKRGEG